jgi:ATP-dependent RNA helicase DDX55/SPB4
MASFRLFVHRIGRTGRNNESGNSLIILLESELAYVDFIQNHEAVKLKPFVTQSLNDQVAEELSEKVRQFAIEDRWYRRNDI